MRGGLVALTLLVGGCPDDKPIDPIVPADYAANTVEVRNCRKSSDHDLNFIRVLADAAAQAPYVNRNAPIPEGALLVKEEFDFADSTCSGAVIKITAAQRLAPGSATDTLDWHWQHLDPDRKVISDNEPRCYNCHVNCVPPDGYESTCAVPP